jgi:hypothetical protein
MRLTCLALTAALACAADTDFVALFDGKTLNGWEVCNGFAAYRVEDGAIVGTTAEGSPNSFLCTQKTYGDFVLEFETKTDPALNSGVQIRSHRYTQDVTVRIFDGKQTREVKQKAGRVYGYQVEVSNEERANSGGIYDEARRGWLHNISNDSAASKAFKDNRWNHYRVVAMGDSIKTWVNGVPCADLVDPLDQEGFIALQVHQYKGKPVEVRWRNIRLQDLGRHAWKPLWNGRDLEGWVARGGGSWKVEDGAIHGASTPGDDRVGFLVGDASFKDLTVRVRFKILKGNSGFFVRADKEKLAAYEVEIDEAARTGGFWETGGRNWVTGPEDNAGVVPNDWNELTASLHGHRIVFHLNGAKTVDLPDDVKGRLEGHLALQAHGKRTTDVWFKDVAILQPVSGK